jgi:hypothetical protein
LRYKKTRPPELWLFTVRAWGGGPAFGWFFKKYVGVQGVREHPAYLGCFPCLSWKAEVVGHNRSRKFHDEVAFWSATGVKDPLASLLQPWQREEKAWHHRPSIPTLLEDSGMLRVVLCAHGVLNTWNLSPQMLGMAAAVREQELVCSPLFD